MAPDLSPLTKDLLFNPGATSILARIEALSSSEIAQGGFKEFFSGASIKSEGVLSIAKIFFYSIFREIIYLKKKYQTI